jgi:hypothetical protein
LTPKPTCNAINTIHGILVLGDVEEVDWPPFSFASTAGGGHAVVCSALSALGALDAGRMEGIAFVAGLEHGHNGVGVSVVGADVVAEAVSRVGVVAETRARLRWC